MNERYCVECGSEMQPLKNGFLFLSEYDLRTSDLWGCKRCMRYQIHGIPVGPPTKVYGEINNSNHVTLSFDPGNEKFWAILKPNLTFSEHFAAHMREWYPDWRF